MFFYFVFGIKQSTLFCGVVAILRYQLLFCSGSKNVVGNSNSFSSSYSSQQHRVSSRGVEGSHRSGNPHLLNPDSRSSIRTSSPANSNTSSNQKVFGVSLSCILWRNFANLSCAF